MSNWKYTSWNNSDTPKYKSKLDRLVENPPKHLKGPFETAFDNVTGKNKKEAKKLVGGFDYATAQSRDILSQSMTYKFNSSTGKFHNENGDVVSTAKEAVKLNDELVKDGFTGNEAQQIRTAAKQKIAKPKQKLSDLDLFYEVGSPKEKAEMRREYKDYNFYRRKFKKDIVEPIKPIKLNLDYGLAEYENIHKTPVTPPPKPAVKVYANEGIGSLERPTHLTLDAYRDLKSKRNYE